MSAIVVEPVECAPGGTVLDSTASLLAPRTGGFAPRNRCIDRHRQPRWARREHTERAFPAAQHACAAPVRQRKGARRRRAPGTSVSGCASYAVATWRTLA